MKLYRRLSVLICASLFGLSVATPTITVAAITDVQREQLARFSLASGEPAHALRWLAGANSDGAKLMRAQAWLHVGKASDAVVAFEQVAAQGKHHRGEAYLMLAKTALSDGDRQAALAAVSRAVLLSDGELKQQAMFYQAELNRVAEQYDQAGQILARMDAGYWAALGYLNLAADYSRIDRDPARALVSLRVAQAMISEDPDEGRSADLATRILLQAGFLSYKRGDYDKALGFLDKIELDSYQAPQALYFHGLAHAANKNYRAAMQSWHRAKKFPLAFPGAVDAWLGMGRGYDESGYLGQAGEAFLAANSAFESERVSLRTLIAQVEQEGAYEALVKAARRDDVEWFLADSRTLTQPRIAYLLHFMETPEAQQVVSRVAELEEMAEMLASREQDLDVFINTLERRQLENNGYTGESARNGVAEEIGRLAGRVRQLKNAASENREQTARLDGIHQSLLEMKRRVMSFDQRLSNAPNNVRQLRDRAVAARLATRAQQQALTGLRDRAEDALTVKAVAFLQHQRERMSYALDRTEQQIAHLYEHLALTGLERGEQP